MPPAARAALTQILIIAGLALSSYLAALKFFALPCLGASGCHAVLHSRFGEIFQIPVGVYSTLLWLAIIYVPDRTKRGFLLLFLGGACVVFMLIQFVILNGFCLYCTLHALVAWSVLYLHGETPRRWTAPLGLALALGGVWLTRQQVETRVTAETIHIAPGTVSTLHQQAAGLYWLGPYTERSPALVLSLNCPACLDLLEELTRRSYDKNAAGPSLYFKTNEANRALTETFVAAVLSQDGTPRDAFLAVTTLFLTQKDTALSSPESAARQLAALFPDSAPRRVTASRILADHTAALQAAALGEATPLLLPRDGKPRAFFKIEDLFPSSPAP
jgi:uncharacterized membrane protein